jgi:hypothetical protein
MRRDSNHDRVSRAAWSFTPLEQEILKPKPYNTSMNHFSSYIEAQAARVLTGIEDDLNAKSRSELINLCFNRYLESDYKSVTKFKAFHKYYFEIGTKPEAEKFFNTFKGQYSLQGVSEEYMLRLNKALPEIKRLIANDDLVTLYFTYFFQVSSKVKNNADGAKTHGSFFTKLVHTFNREGYTPLDNPMRDHFKLQNESFFIAMLIVSKAFKLWCDSYRTQADELKKELALAMTKGEIGPISASDITDMKLMDTIYWAIANGMSTDNSDLE